MEAYVATAFDDDLVHELFTSLGINFQPSGGNQAKPPGGIIGVQVGEIVTVKPCPSSSSTLSAVPASDDAGNFGVITRYRDLLEAFFGE